MKNRAWPCVALFKSKTLKAGSVTAASLCPAAPAEGEGVTVLYRTVRVLVATTGCRYGHFSMSPNLYKRGGSGPPRFDVVH